MNDPQYKQMMDFLIAQGIAEMSHTSKTYMGHLLAVYKLMQDQGCDIDTCRAGIFHSIYGTEEFQRFQLVLERRDEVRAIIGERGERLAYLNCAMDRASFDLALERHGAPYPMRDRFNGTEIMLTAAEFDDLCKVHLYDWLEQVPRSRRGYPYRRAAYRRMAERLGANALGCYERIFANEPASVP